MNRRTSLSGIGLLAASAVCYASLSLFVTWLAEDGVSAWFQVAARLALSAAILLIVTAVFQRDALRVVHRRRLIYLAVNGFLVLAGASGFTLSISLGTPPTRLALLAYLSPIYVAVLGTKILGETFTKTKLVAVALGLAGILLTLKVWDDGALARFQLGDLLATSVGFVIAAQVLFARWSGLRDKTHPLTFSLWSMLFALGWLTVPVLGLLLWRGPALLLAHVPDTIGPRIVANILGIVVPGSIFAYTLFYMGLERTEASVAGVILLFEPVSIFIFSFLFLHHPIGWWQFVGGGAILAAGALVAR